MIEDEITKLQEINASNEINSSQNSTSKKFLPTPYIKGTSERIQKIIKKYNMFLSNSASNTLSRQLISLKDKTSIGEKCGVVYQIKCGDCSNSDIGETGRNLKTRIKEHEKDIQQGKLLSQVYQHHQESGHNFDFDNVGILQQNSSTWQRKRLEAYYSFSY